MVTKEENFKINLYALDLDILTKNTLTPNQWILLNIVNNKDEVAYIQYYELGRLDILKDDLYNLYKKDYIINDGVTNWTFNFSELHISEKGKLIINNETNIIDKKQSEFEEFMKKYMEIFPEKVYSGNSLPVRSNPKLCKSKMISFIKEYKYDYETILKATESYVKKCKQGNYNFMKTSYYFIKKDGESILETYCQEVLSKPKDNIDAFSTDFR